jgi:Putative zinc-finger
MDHNEAVRMLAAEKYLLGELPKTQRDEYEEHYFDCPACAEDLQTTVVFLESAKQVARQEARKAVDAKRLVPDDRSGGGWFGWLRPAFAVPVLAVLLLFIGYQNGVVIPHLKQTSSNVAIGNVAKSFSLVSSGARGEGSSTDPLKVGPTQDFSLNVDMPGNSASGYVCQIQDESGRVLGTFPVSPEEAKDTVQLNMRGGSLQPGKYNFSIFAGQTLPAKGDGRSAAAQKSFTVEFVK